MTSKTTDMKRRVSKGESMTQITSDNITNFMYEYDDKKRAFEEIQEYVNDTTFRHLRDPNLLSVLLYNHPDLFLKNEKDYVDVLGEKLFIFHDYLTYREVFTKIYDYFEKLQRGQGTSSNKERKKSKFFILDQKQSSIFDVITPGVFAYRLNKLYMYCYIVLETRFLQYIAKHQETRKTDYMYAGKLKGIYNNFIRKMEHEVEIYCKSKRVNEVISIFDLMIAKFLQLGNTPLAKALMMIMKTKIDCDAYDIHTVLDKYNAMLAAKRFVYLVEPGTITKAFITSYEIPQKQLAFNKIYEKLKTNRGELITFVKDTISNASEVEDVDRKVYEYIDPDNVIEEPLFKTYKETLDIKCIRESCK